MTAIYYTSCLLKAAVDAGLNIAAAERRALSKLTRDLNTLLQQQTESRFINGACVIRHQTE